MNELQSFHFEGNGVRVTVIDDEPYFVGKDVAKAIGYVHPTKAVNDHVKTKYRRGAQIGTPSGTQRMVVISEPGMFQFVAQSGLPKAEPFQDWLFEIVLPAIKNHGGYLTPNAVEQAVTNPDFLRNLANQLEEEQRARQLAEGKVKLLEPKAEYYDRILANKGLVSTTSIAKNYGMSAKAFNKLLHQMKIQFRQGDSWYPYSKYQDKGYTHTEPVPYKHHDGRDDVKPQTKWTQKGHVFIYETLKKHGIVPMIEQEQSV